LAPGNTAISWRNWLKRWRKNPDRLRISACQRRVASGFPTLLLSEWGYSWKSFLPCIAIRHNQTFSRRFLTTDDTDRKSFGLIAFSFLSV
jgi:hypothetical protein